MNSWSHQIILGTLLGNGYIQKTKKSYYMGFSESHDRNWFYYKYDELKELSADTPVLVCRNVLKWRSRSGPNWEPYWDLFYGSGRIIPMKALDQLRDIGLAVWFADKGFWYSNRQVGLRTSKFIDRKNGVDYFNEVGIPCEEKRKSLVFTPYGTTQFLSTIAHRLPEFLHCRLTRPLV